MDQKKNIPEIFSTISNYFSPKIIGEVNDVYIKLARVKGQDVPWHIHDNEDELFYVVKGSITIELKNGNKYNLKEGEMYIVKQGTEHRVYGDEECWLMLVENKGTKHTGDVQSHITKSEDEQHY